MNDPSAFEKTLVRELKEDALWGTRQRWFWLMFVPLPVIILQWVVLPVPLEELPNDYARTFIYVVASWAALCASVVAAAAPEEQGPGRRLATGLLLWLGVTGLNGLVLGIIHALSGPAS
jgi:hypothetical protein